MAAVSSPAPVTPPERSLLAQQKYRACESRLQELIDDYFVLFHHKPGSNLPCLPPLELSPGKAGMKQIYDRCQASFEKLTQTIDDYRQFPLYDVPFFERCASFVYQHSFYDPTEHFSLLERYRIIMTVLNCFIAKNKYYISVQTDQLTSGHVKPAHGLRKRITSKTFDERIYYVEATVLPTIQTERPLEHTDVLPLPKGHDSYNTLCAWYRNDWLRTIFIHRNYNDVRQYDYPFHRQTYEEFQQTFIARAELKKVL